MIKAKEQHKKRYWAGARKSLHCICAHVWYFLSWDCVLSTLSSTWLHLHFPPPQTLSQHCNILVHFKYISFLQASLNARLAWVSSGFPNRRLCGPRASDVRATSSICCPVFGLYRPHSQPSFSACLLRCLFLWTDWFLSCRQGIDDAAIGLLIHGRKVKTLTI